MSFYASSYCPMFLHSNQYSCHLMSPCLHLCHSSLFHSHMTKVYIISLLFILTYAHPAYPMLSNPPCQTLIPSCVSYVIPCPSKLFRFIHIPYMVFHDRPCCPMISMSLLVIMIVISQHSILSHMTPWPSLLFSHILILSHMSNLYSLC